MVSFIIRGGSFAMPVRLSERSPDGMKWNPGVSLHATWKITHDLNFPGFRTVTSGVL